MQIDLLCTTLGGQFNHGCDMVLVAVYATFGEQTHDVDRFALACCRIDGLAQCGIIEEVAVTNFFRNPGQFLVDNATSTNIDVTYFGVTHLTIRQTHIHAGCGDQGVGIVSTQGVQIRRLGTSNGVEFFFGAITPTIHDD